VVCLLLQSSEGHRSQGIVGSVAWHPLAGGLPWVLLFLPPIPQKPTERGPSRQEMVAGPSPSRPEPPPVLHSELLVGSQ
jgi:hypothetical protein